MLDIKKGKAMTTDSDRAEEAIKWFSPNKYVYVGEVERLNKDFIEALAAVRAEGKTEGIAEERESNAKKAEIKAFEAIVEAARQACAKSKQGMPLVLQELGDTISALDARKGGKE